MQRLIILIYVFLSVGCICCNEKKDKAEIITSYKTIRSAMIDADDVQDRFFVKATQLLGQIKDNKDAIVDTKGFEGLLDSARNANDNEIKIISSVKEPDSEIKYREKSLNFANLLSALYQKQFREFISILNSKSDGRFEKSQTILYGKLLEWKQSKENWKQANQEMRDKYNITN